MIVSALFLLQVAAVKVLDQVDPLTDDRTVALVAQAGGSHLFVACNVKQAKLFSYVETDRFLYTRRSADIGYRFDDDEPREPVGWSQETHRVDVADIDVLAFARRLVTADRLRLRFYEAPDRQIDVLFAFEQLPHMTSPKLEGLRSVAGACSQGRAGRALSAAIQQNGLSLPSG